MSVCNVLLYYARPFSGFTTLPFFYYYYFQLVSLPPFISSTFFLSFYVCPFVSSARCIILAKRSRQKAKQGHKNKNCSTFLWGGGSTVQPLKKKKKKRENKRGQNDGSSRFVQKVEVEFEIDRVPAWMCIFSADG